jgi:glycosyltransferase involved in cell wall biosynthesis
MSTQKKKLSVVIPCYNEGLNVQPFYKELSTHLKSISTNYDYEIIYVNDGSRDNTLEELHAVAQKDKGVIVINLSRNFGKEIATTTGIHYAKGDAIMMIDADGQHPANLIPSFVQKWHDGAQVVIGVRVTNQKEGLIKKYGSKLFYAMFNKFTGTNLVPGSTDFRLIDKTVQAEFVKMTERNRITRGLIDWLGFKHDYIKFKANARMAGEASYSVKKLIQLAMNSFVSLSLAPLYFSVYAGLLVLPLSVAIGLFSIVEMLTGDPLSLNITGTAFLVILILFFVGVLLISQGIIALYLSHIHTETQNRPLFIIDKHTSRGINIEEV